MNKLTPLEFVELPLSQAITLVITDLKNWKHDINMNSWWKTYEQITKCSACLGGIAILSFYTNKEQKQLIEGDKHPFGYGSEFKVEHQLAIKKIGSAFNELRRGNIEKAFLYWYNEDIPNEILLNSTVIELGNTNPFVGSIDKIEKKKLIKYLKDIAKLLKEHGY